MKYDPPIIDNWVHQKLSWPLKMLQNHWSCINTKIVLLSNQFSVKTDTRQFYGENYMFCCTVQTFQVISSRRTTRPRQATDRKCYDNFSSEIYIWSGLVYFVVVGSFNCLQKRLGCPRKSYLCIPLALEFRRTNFSGHIYVWCQAKKEGYL